MMDHHTGKDRRGRHFVLLRTGEDTGASETWLFFFDPDQLGRLYELVGQYAAADDLSFTWSNARDVIARAQHLVRAHA